MKNKILVTGGAGFIGSHFVHSAVSQNYKVCVIDKLTYAGSLERLKSIKSKINFYKTDICHLKDIQNIFNKEQPSIVVHFAGETHVDRSLENIQPFIHTNIGGTQSLITAAEQFGIKKFIHISTDEVYGEGIKGKRFKENHPINPTNPYAVTKATAEMLVSEAGQLKKLPAVIIRPCNTYGPGQNKEKLIPVIIAQAAKNKKIPIYGRGLQIREWLYVSDCVEGIFDILKKSSPGDIFNIGSGEDSTNIHIAQTILTMMKKPLSLINFVKDRECHDFCYLVDNKKISKLGWKPKVSLKEGLEKTINSHQKTA